MKRSKLQQREQGRWQPLYRATITQKTPEQKEALVQGIVSNFPEYTEAQTRDIIEKSHNEIREVWKNDQYTVMVIKWPPMEGWPPIVQLSIRRNDRAPMRDWRHFQRIKNEIVGPECEAVELYPAESRLVDTANQYHLWCIADPDFRIPLGYHTRTVGSRSFGNAQQRPHEEAADD